MAPTTSQARRGNLPNVTNLHDGHTEGVPTSGGATSLIVEFLLVGGVTLLLFPVAWLARRIVGLDPAEYAVGFLTFHGAHLINDPHFAATYLLFYKDVRGRAFGNVFTPLQRFRYWVAGLIVPLALVIWTATAIYKRSAPSIGWMLQTMFFLVGWHYAKQGFGVLTVLSARRGFTYSPSERRVFLAHSFACWAYAWASPSDPGRWLEEKGVVFASIPHGPDLELISLLGFLASAIALVVTIAIRLRSHGQLPPVAPLLGFLITLWFWTIFTSIDPLMVYLIPALHSIQYLYFVTLLRHKQAIEEEGPPYFGRPASTQLALLALSTLALGWLLFHGTPRSLDAILTPRGSRLSNLGPTPFCAALSAAVNIHHYFMDHVIWRRENPDTRHLRA